ESRNRPRRHGDSAWPPRAQRSPYDRSTNCLPVLTHIFQPESFSPGVPLVSRTATHSEFFAVTVAPFVYWRSSQLPSNRMQSLNCSPTAESFVSSSPTLPASSS